MNTDPIPQMGHVKDGEKRYTANSIYASSSIHRDDQFVTLAAYQEVEAEKAAAEQTYCDRIEHLRAQLESVVAERDVVRLLLKDLCAEWNEECDPKCDSWGHDDECRAVHIIAAKKALNAELAAARARARTVESAAKTLASAAEQSTTQKSFDPVFLKFAAIEMRRALTSLEGGQKPDSRQAGDS